VIRFRNCFIILFYFFCFWKNLLETNIFNCLMNFMITQLFSINSSINPINTYDLDGINLLFYISWNSHKFHGIIDSFCPLVYGYRLQYTYRIVYLFVLLNIYVYVHYKWAVNTKFTHWLIFASHE